MAGGEYERGPASLPELIARTLQLSLHHQMLSDYERLREHARIVVLCPITAPTATWVMKREHVEAVMESSPAGMAGLLPDRGPKPFPPSRLPSIPPRLYFPPTPTL